MDRVQGMSQMMKNYSCLCDGATVRPQVANRSIAKLHLGSLATMPYFTRILYRPDAMRKKNSDLCSCLAIVLIMAHAEFLLKGLLRSVSCHHLLATFKCFYWQSCEFFGNYWIVNRFVIDRALAKCNMISNYT